MQVVHQAFADAALDRWEVAYARWAGGGLRDWGVGAGVATSTEWGERESCISRCSGNSNRKILLRRDGDSCHVGVGVGRG